MKRTIQIIASRISKRGARSRKRIFTLTSFTLAVCFFACALPLPSSVNVRAQKKRRHVPGAPPKNVESNEAKAAADELARRRAELIKAVNDSKASLAQLLVYRETNLRAALKERDQLKELYAQGLVAKQRIVESDGKIAAAQTEINKVREGMDAADKQIAHVNETIAEEKAAALLAKAPPLARGGYVQTTSYVRYEGPGGFSLLADAGKITNFFVAKFGHALPVSAFGQTSVHDRLGFDHRNAMDVAVPPDSPQGIALLNYLRGAGIPFIAFRSAVPGSATGAHIHIGRPSHRL